MMLGFLLARAGIDVVVLEKHADFLRDFRGDTVHPSTMQVMHELGLLDAFLARPAQRSPHARRADRRHASSQVADFSHLPTQAKFIAFMPQWDFLDFLADQANRFPTFRLMMRTEATDLIREGDQMVGVRARGPDGMLDIRAELIVARDGRHSTLRDAAGFGVVDLGAPMDVLWLRLSKHASRSRTDARPHRRRAHLHHAGSRRLLAVRVRHPQGRHRRGPRTRPRCLPHRDRASRAVPAGPRPRTHHMGRREAADRSGEPARYLVSPRPAVHRRRSPRDVAGWWRRHQPGDPGRRRDRQYPGPAFDPRPGDARRPARRSASSRMADAHDAAPSGGGAESRHQQCAAQQCRRRRRPSPRGCSAGSPCCGACRHALSAWASAPSTSGTEQPSC